jgi:hypothetical protein
LREARSCAKLIVMFNLLFSGALAFLASTANARGLPVPQDTAALRIASLRVALEQIVRSRNDSLRIWITAESQPDSTSAARTLPLPAHAWSAVQAAFPAAWAVRTMDEAFLCPPGVEVRMPGSSCPIRESGIIVQFGPLTIAGDSARAAVFIVQSAPTAGRISTWGEVVVFLFVRREEGWQYDRIVMRYIT